MTGADPAAVPEAGQDAGLPAPDAPRLRDWAERLTLPLLLAAALALRLFGIGWDGGFLFHPDERALLTHTYDFSLPSLGNLGVLLSADESPLNPRWFPYGTLPMYLLKAAQLALSPVLSVDLVALSRIGRALSAVADVATVWAAYRLALAMFGRRAALLTAAFLAFAVLHVQLSHFFAAETFQTFFVVASLLCMVRYVQGGRLRDVVLAGALAGLALATKASSAPLLLPLALAPAMAAWRVAPLGGGAGLGAVGLGAAGLGALSAWRTQALALLAAIGACAAAFLVAEPYALLDSGRFLADVSEQSEVVRRIRDYPYTRQYVDTAPYLYHVWQLALFGLGAPLLGAALGGLAYAGAVVVRRGDAACALLLAFLVPLLLITGALEVKFPRYLLPATPLLIVLGAGMLVAGVDALRARRPALARWATAGVGVAVVATALYALSYAAMLATPHPAVEAAAWVRRHAPEGALLLKEHWEEGLPNLHDYRHAELPMYEPDSPAKLEAVTAQLAAGDFLLFYSSRLFATIPRLPVDYPIPYRMTRAYYPLLFGGELGYTLAHAESKYPSLLGVSLVNDVFGRAGLSPPPGIDAFAPGGVAVGMGFADESFSVYDHPQVLVFENTGRLTQAQLDAALRPALDAGAPYDAMRMPAGEWSTQRAGGDLRAITPADGLGARWALPAWLLAVYAGALATLPLGLVVFRALPDRGYLLARPLGLLVLSYTPWLLASLHWVGFGRSSVALGLALATAASWGLAYRHRRSLLEFLRRRWRFLLAQEALFLGAFLAFALVRAANPDLWHPYLGGEKPMDFAYLNAVLRSTVMPPLDPWFAGGAMNYYYFGHFMTATVVHATGVPTATAYNLAVPLFFALTAGAAFSLGYNLAEGARRGLRRAARAVPRWSPYAAGAAAVMLAVVLGNLDGAGQLLRGAVADFDFWGPSRMMPPDPPGFEITEFPFFTFLFADLHAHLMAMPLALLAVGLCLNTALLMRRRVARWRLALSLGLLSLAVGALAATNTWDFPVYLALGVASIAAGSAMAARGVERPAVHRAAALAATFCVLAVLLWLPFHLRLTNGFPGVASTPATTPLLQYLAIHGLLLYLAASLLAVELAAPVRGWLAGRGARGLWVVAGALAVCCAAAMAWSGYALVGALGLALLAVAAAAARWAADPAGRRAAPYRLLALGLLAAALALGIGADLLVVRGDIDRLNTVFKLYLQAWLFLSVAGAYAVWHVGFVRGGFAWRGRLQALWALGLAALVLAAAVYPVLGTRDRLGERFAVTPLTLDGTAYMRTAVYDDLGPTELRWDLDAIEWLREGVDGTPVVLDGRTSLYRWGSRVSVYTGLPTVLGWDWHQRQQRCGLDPCPAVDARIAAVDAIFAGQNANRALSLLDEYDVDYVYIGQTERQYYPPSALLKFDTMAAEGKLTVAYQNPKVTIYRVPE